MKRILLVLFLAPSAAFAQADSTDIRYSWIQLAHVMTATDADLDSSGWNFQAAFAVRDHIHLFADTESAELDDFEQVTGRETTLGIGANFDLVERFSVFGRAGWYDVSADDGATTAEDDGIRAIAGVRFVPLPGYELRGGVDYIDLDLSGDDTAGFAAADIFLADGIALTGEVLFFDDGESYTVGARLYFGD
ncbi:MAG TPA: hypothetical protein VFG91_12030 [Woeseiaceae bacterium]|nr:hypothetical protein [Woeseiaceae bacterium]